MKVLKWLNTLVMSAVLTNSVVALAQPESNTAETSKTPKKKKKKKEKDEEPSNLYYSSLGSGKTLPEGYARTRFFSQFIQGDRKYGSDGKPEDVGYKLSAVAEAIAVEYGLSENLSFQLLIPYVTKNSIAFSKRAHKESRTFAENKAYYENAFFSRLQKIPDFCSSRAECVTVAQTDKTLPEGTEFVLPTGETFPVGGQPVNKVLAGIPELIANAAEPADGEVGLGDIDFGITYVAYQNKNHILSLGLGIRIPAGPYENVPQAKRPPGEGLMKGGLRLNYDCQITQALWFSFQHQFDTVFAAGKRRKSSQLNPEKLNEEDPTSDEAIAAGSNGEPNLQAVTRKGIGHVGFFRLDYGLSGWHPSLQPVAIEGTFLYEKGAAPYLGNYKVNDGLQRYSVGYGIKFDGLGLKKPFPAYVRILRDRFLEGKNVPIATSSIIVEFAFYKPF